MAVSWRICLASISQTFFFFSFLSTDLFIVHVVLIPGKLNMTYTNCVHVRGRFYICAFLKKNKVACVVLLYCKTTTPQIFLSSVLSHTFHTSSLVACCLLQTNQTTGRVIFTQQSTLAWPNPRWWAFCFCVFFAFLLCR